MTIQWGTNINENDSVSTRSNTDDTDVTVTSVNKNIPEGTETVQDLFNSLGKLAFTDSKYVSEDRYNRLLKFIRRMSAVCFGVAIVMIIAVAINSHATDMAIKNEVTKIDLTLSHLINANAGYSINPVEYISPDYGSPYLKRILTKSDIPTLGPTMGEFEIDPSWIAKSTDDTEVLIRELNEIAYLNMSENLDTVAIVETDDEGLGTYKDGVSKAYHIDNATKYAINFLEGTLSDSYQQVDIETIRWLIDDHVNLGEHRYINGKLIDPVVVISIDKGTSMINSILIEYQVTPELE